MKTTSAVYDFLEALVRLREMEERMSAPPENRTDSLIGSAPPARPEQAEPPVEPVLDTTRPTWHDADAHYRKHYGQKLSFKQECVWLDELLPFLGAEPLDCVYSAKLEPFIQAQREKPVMRGAKVLKVGVKSKTINLKLALVRHILMEAWRSWRLPTGQPWLTSPPKIKMVEGGDERPPRPLTWEEQEQHLHDLPQHLYRMALFDLNCGVREDVVCNLQWPWLKELHGISFFVVPPEHVKGRRGKKSARVLVLNSVAKRVVEECRGEHDTHVFTYRKKDGARQPIRVMNNTAWQSFRARCGLGDLHVHDLRHTVGMRLREAGVSEETRAAILWHKTMSMTGWYSQTQIREVYDALELITKPSNAKNVSLQSLMREAA